MTLYFKALRSSRRGTHTNFAWPPPGEVVRVKGPLQPCEHGLHVCRPDQIFGWLSDELWLVEASDRFGHIDHGDKMVVREASLVRQLTAWDERSARLFAADCAERVLHIFERTLPGDDRPRLAIEAARAYARVEIGDAARDAAGAAAEDAAWAAWAAADAAGDAAWAAWDAAWAAAGDAARAAGDAAGDAARAAGDAAGAAGDAAGDAAWAAAWAAERAWQTGHLLDMLDLTDDERAGLGVAS